jgi:hypothetical protein
MQKTLQLIQKISSELDRNWLPEMREINIHKIFDPVYKLPELRDMSISKMNAVTCFIVFAYDNDSSWLNLKQDRYENKSRIFKSLDVDVSKIIFDEIMMNESESINTVIGEYLIEQTNWKWRAVTTLLDYSAKMMRFANQHTETERQTTETNEEGKVSKIAEAYDIDKITKVNKEKGQLLTQAIDAREKADKLLTEIRKEYVNMEHAVQSDFNFSVTDEKKIDPMSWSHWIEQRNKKRAAI